MKLGRASVSRLGSVRVLFGPWLIRALALQEALRHCMIILEGRMSIADKKVKPREKSATDQKNVHVSYSYRVRSLHRQISACLSRHAIPLVTVFAASVRSSICSSAPV